MNKKIRFFGIILAVVILCSALTGCGGRGDGDPPVYTSDNKVVMTLGGYNVTYDFYRYLFLNTKFSYDNGDPSYWEKSENNVETIKEDVYNSLKKTYAMFVLADKYDVTLTDDDNTYIDNYITESKKGLSKEEYKESLKASYMNEELYRFLLEVQLLETNLFYHICTEENGIIKLDDATFLKALDEEFARASHILFTFKDETQKNAAYTEAQAVLEKLKNGEDFETLKEEYSDDTALKGKKDGYYFTHGEFKNEFEYTAFELKEGEISEIVLSDVGYHIVKRLPIEDEYVDKNFETLRTQYKTSLYYKMLEEEYKQFTPNYKGKFKTVTLDTFN